MHRNVQFQDKISNFSCRLVSTPFLIGEELSVLVSPELPYRYPVHLNSKIYILTTALTDTMP